MWSVTTSRDRASPADIDYPQAVYQSLLHLTWVDKLLDNIKTIFVDLYKDQLQKPSASVVEYRFDGYFDQQMRELEASSGATTARDAPRAEVEQKKDSSINGDTGGPPPPPVPGLLKAQRPAAPSPATSNQSTPLQSPDTSRPTTPLPNHLLSAKNGPPGRGSRRARKAANTSANTSDADENKKAKPAAKSGPKKMRRWDADGMQMGCR